ncbi:MAG TPA: metal ABC transporter permease [Gammaproteobacteria bacterium]|nr:metal ABC transporter permease [Gammaproteobacteria bacterium]
MAEFIHALVQHAFLQNALMSGLLAGITCGVVGSFVVVKRIGFLAGGIAHTVLGGMGAALFFGFNPTGGALVAAILAALLIGLATLHSREREDTLIAALWATGMAVGILFITKTPGYNTELMSYLFGNILMVSKQDLWLMAAMASVLILIIMLFFKQFLAVTFDEEFAVIRGIPVTLFYLLLLCIVAVTVVLLIQVVGLILVIALLTLPAAIAGQYTRTLMGMMLLATVLGIAFTAGGLSLSYAPDLPPGATIILLAGVTYVISTLITRSLARWKAKRMV